MRSRGPETRLGIVFQSPVLLDWRTALGNVLLQVELRGLDPRPYEARARALLAAVGLKGSRITGRASSRAGCASAAQSCAR